ncbi:MAG: hypothetical protein ACOC3V_05700 [bacterium]
MWLRVKPPDSPFEKVVYYYDYNIRDARDDDVPSYYKIEYRVMIIIRTDDLINIKFDSNNIFSAWDRDHSKEINNIGSNVRKKTIKKIFKS